MRLKFTLTLGALLAAPAVSLALVRPPEGTALTNYDVRETPRGVAVYGSPAARLQASRGHAQRVNLSAEKQEALGRLERAAGGPVVARWSPLTDMPKVLFRYEGPLSGPDWQDAADVARNFLLDYAGLYGFSTEAVQSLRETRRFTTHNGSLTVLHLEQEVGGVPVFHGYVRFTLTARGEVASVTTTDPLPAVAGFGLTPDLDPGEALLRAAPYVGETLSAPLARTNPAGEQWATYEKGPFMSQPRLQTVFFPVGRGARLAYQILLEKANVPAYYEVVVDATDGALLWRANMTAYAQTEGLIFPESPEDSANVPVRTQFYDSSVLTDPRWPEGWVFSDRSIGNVADCKEDWIGDNETTIGQRSFDFVPGAPVFFEDPWTNAYATGGSAKADAFFAMTNMVYFANKYHNWLYPAGFDEASGNWQKSNYGRGGAENDWVNVDIQDGYDRGQRNNANMSTPPDGSNPRAQFFAFSPPFFARRDSDVDGDVVIHEFTHGLSNRLIGGASSTSCLSAFQGGSMGEGWSDFYALAFYDDPVMGEYATGNPTVGIRGAAYDAYPACHNFSAAGFCAPSGCGGVVGACEVHDEGELWAATLWEMRALLIAADPANGADIALRLVTDGMKLSPCLPTFLDARDGILLADRYNYAGAHVCLIWEAFKDRYMGWSATTTDPNDQSPSGTNDFPPFCQNAGSVVLNLDSYGCNDTLIATVHDANASGSPAVRLTSAPTGDTLNIALTGVSPTFISNAVPVALGAANTADTTLQANPGDTITAEYADANPANLAQATAPVNCLADVSSEFEVLGGCAADSLTWPVPLPQILDAGELVDVRVRIYNREPRDLTNVTVSVSAVSNPMVVPITSQVSIGSLPRYTGAGTATFRFGASRFLAAGTVDIDFQVQADGFTGTAAPIRYTIPVNSNYASNSLSTGIENFEASDAGYVHYFWPYAGPIDEWQYGICGAASGTKAWYVGPASCSGNAQNQDSNLDSPPFDPTTPTRVSWYPTALNFNARIQLGGSGASSDLLQLYWGAPDLVNSGNIFFGTFAEADSTNNTGPSFQPFSVNYTGADTLGAGDKLSGGVVWAFDLVSLVSGGLTQNVAVDDVEVTYDVADASPAAGAPTCVEAGYHGAAASCAGTTTWSAYAAARPAEMQFAGNGRFWLTSPDWNLFDVEFPTATSSGDVVVLLGNANPGGGSHAGTMGVNGRAISNPESTNFGTTTCAAIPTPVGPASPIAQGQQIVLSWTPYVESGSAVSVVGYRVYRLNAETYPPATSTIQDYINNGVLRGTTVGQANINRFVDTAPAVASPPQDEYSYAIQPMFRCDGLGCTGPVPAEFGGTETSPGTANLSTDNLVSNGGAPVPGTVVVSQAMLAAFDGWSASRDGNAVVVRWSTSSEIDTLAYDVYRGTTPDEASMVRVGRVMARGPSRYELRDTTAPAGGVYYQVREIATSGAPSRTDVFGLDGPVVGGGGGARGGRGRGRAASGGSPSGNGETLLQERRSR